MEQQTQTILTIVRRYLLEAAQRGERTIASSTVGALLYVDHGISLHDFGRTAGFDTIRAFLEHHGFQYNDHNLLIVPALVVEQAQPAQFVPSLAVAQNAPPLVAAQFVPTLAVAQNALPHAVVQMAQPPAQPSTTVVDTGLQNAMKDIIEHVKILLQVAAGHSKKTLKYDSIRGETVEDTGHDIEFVATRLGFADGHQFLRGNGFEFNDIGDFIVPPAVQSVTMFFIQAAHKEAEERNRRRNRTKMIQPITTRVVPEAEPEQENVVPVGDRVNDPNVIHEFDGNTSMLHPGMYVRIANGGVHYLPPIPEFGFESDVTQQLQKQAEYDFKRMVKELVRQHEAALAKRKMEEEMAKKGKK